MNEALETMIDSHGVARVLESLYEICCGKADHVETNWQDKGLANAWRTVAKRIDAAESTASKYQL